jgi:tRNA-modifying protein YgfZ
VSGGDGYTALRERAGAVEIDRDVVRVSGPDAESYLQGQTSQDIARLAAGDWAWALVLQPQGKLDAFVRVFRAGPAEFLVDTDAGVGEPLVARLLRFRLRTKADIEQLDWRAVAVRGPSAAVPSGPGRAHGADGAAVPFEWRGFIGYDILGPAPQAPAEVPVVGAGDYEAARMEAGFPRHGTELDERTIPAEAGLVEASVSFTKGCYTGQELVARIDSRGNNVPRNLRGLLLAGPARAGMRLYKGGAEPAATEGADASPPESDPGAPAREVGRLTSVAYSPRLGWVALGYVGRTTEVGSELLARADEDEVAARVELLPLK